jgi:hypothetical protein
MRAHLSLTTIIFLYVKCSFSLVMILEGLRVDAF